MALEVHVAGPGLDVARRLEPGEPALIIGRDSDCAIPLPDPERNISRRHLSVWNEADQLHFHVLSVVNGVRCTSGDVPPGARGVLQPGEALMLAAFRVAVALAPPPPPPAAPAGDSGWSQLQQQAEQLPVTAEAAAGAPNASLVREEDPFGDWGFNSTFGGSPERALRASGLAAATDLQPFLTGLGLEASAQVVFTRDELETIGRLTRIALQGLLQASAAAAGTRQEARAEGHATAEQRELNPLRMDTPLEIKLHYLFGGASAATGFMPPDQAVAQVASELAAHEQAMGPAVQDTVKGVLAEFEPEALKQRLLGAGGAGRLFGSARAWDAFARDYAGQAAAQPGWVQQLLDRHFNRAYARALLRAKRNTTGRPGS